MGIFGDLERTLAELYAFRWPLGIGILVMLAAFAAFGYRRGPQCNPTNNLQTTFEGED